MRTAPFRLKPQWKIHAHALFQLCFCSVTQISDNFCGSLHQLFFWISLSLCFSPFWWFRAEERHLSAMSRDRRRKRHPRQHQVAERRGWALGRRCHRYSQDTHYHFSCGRALMFLSQPGPGVTCKLTRHRASPGRAPGCCAGLLRWASRAVYPSSLKGHCGELARHKPRSCFFVRFCWRLLLLLTSLLCWSILCCLPMNDGSSVPLVGLLVRKADTEFNFSGSVPCCFDLGTLEQHVRCLSPSGLLLRCSCSTIS